MYKLHLLYVLRKHSAMFAAKSPNPQRLN